MDIQSIVIRVLVETITDNIATVISDLFSLKFVELTGQIDNQLKTLEDKIMATVGELFTAQAATAASLIELNSTIIAEAVEVKDLLTQIKNGVIVAPEDLQTAIDSAGMITTGLATASDSIKAMVPTLATPPVPTPPSPNPVPAEPIPVPPTIPPVDVPVVIEPTSVGTNATKSVKFR